MTGRFLLSAVLTLGLAAGAQAKGPPWISIELPANPHHASTRDATLLVRAYHHSAALTSPVSGTAEGIVDGRRVSLPLEVRPTHQPGVYAVRTPLPKGGTWIMAITVTESKTATATALVSVDTRGRIVGVEVPSDRTRDGWLVPRTVDAKDIETALRAAHVAYSGETGEAPGYAIALALPILLLGGVAAVRLRY